MKKLKVMTIVGTRPEIIKLSLIMKELDKHFDHTITHTGQNYDYELNEIFFKDLELRKPDYFLKAAGTNAAETIGNVITKVDQLFEKIQPDAVVLYGDTNSCLSVIAAKRKKIPIFHLEAGNRCFDQRVPEEINRKIVDHLSDINIVHSEQAREYLIREGIRAEMIFKSGSPMREILTHFKNKIESSSILKTLNLNTQGFFLVSCHREENVDFEDQLTSLCESLNLMAREYKKPIIFSTHPRTKNQIDQLNFKFDSLVQIMKPLGFFDYLKLQISAQCTLSDSGTITEESSILGFPAIMIRHAHERPEGSDVAAVLMSELKFESIQRCLSLLSTHKSNTPISDYASTDVSVRVAKWILSYTDYINRYVWRKKL